MKFYVHLFEEVRHKYEIEADDLEAAVALVKADPNLLLDGLRGRHLASESTGELVSDFLIDPLDENGEVDYNASTWRTWEQL